MKKHIYALAALALVATASLTAHPQGMPLPPTPEEVVIEMFANFDANENDLLEKSELTSALRERGKERRAAMRERFQERREKAEAAGRELPSPGKRKSLPKPKEIATRMLENFDSDEDSALSAEEAIAAVAKMQDKMLERRERRVERWEERMAERRGQRDE